MTQDFNIKIFEPDFPFEGVHLVAASAGTGKTYNIQNIYARLVMEKALAVSQIQVMTFTEAATKELCARLRSILKDVWHRFRKEDCESTETDPKKRDEDIKDKNRRADALIHCAEKNTNAFQLVEIALQEFDTASISTIHGFCSRILERYAFENRTPFRFEMKNDKNDLLNQTVDDWWRIHRGKTTITRKDLNRCVEKISGKTGYQLDFSTENPDRLKGDELLLYTARQIVQQYEKSRINSDTKTFDDLLHMLRDALAEEAGGKTLAENLRKDFKAALIDEFQDTDPVQYEIFEKVFIADEQIPVFFVGDPKQAIYAFRGGDINTYCLAAEKVPPERQYSQKKNFRSTPQLMKAVNAIFMDKDGQTVFENPVIRYDEEIQASDKPALKINGIDDPSPFKVIHSDNDAIIPRLAAEIAKLLNQYKGILSPKDIAILMWSTTDVPKIREELQKAGIPSVLQKSGNVFRTDSPKDFWDHSPSQMAKDIYSILDAIISPLPKKVKRALVVPISFFGFSADEILNMNDVDLAKWIGRFSEMNHIWYRKGFSAVLERMERYSIKDEHAFRERLAAKKNGERLLSDFDQIIELLFITIKQQGPSPDALLDWLKKSLTEDDNDDEAYARQLESEFDAVKIMTIFVSKGLEFKVVFLPDCCKVNGNHDHRNQTPYPYYHKGTQSYFSFNGNREAKKMAKKEISEERKRDLYVAMTRAIQRTVLFNPQTTVNGQNNPQPKILSDADAQISNDEGNVSPIIDISNELPDNVKYQPQDRNLILSREAQALPTFLLQYKKRTKGSYSALSPQMEEQPETNESPEKDQGSENEDQPWIGTENRSGIFCIRGGAAIGNCWHDILEKISFDAKDEEIRTQAKMSLRENGFDPEFKPDERTSMLEMTLNMIGKVLSYDMKSIDDKELCLSSIGWQDRLSEQEFNFSSASAMEKTGAIADILRKYWSDDSDKALFLETIRDWDRDIPKGFLNGFIDLIFRQNDHYYIIDWKSNSLGGNAGSFIEKEVRNEMARHGYFFQYLLYSVVLHKYLKQSLGDRYNWQQNFGGIRYVFLRGIAENGPAPVFADRPPESMLDEIAQVLGMEE